VWAAPMETGIVADVLISRRPVVDRLLVAVVAMFLGALISAVLVQATRLDCPWHPQRSCSPLSQLC